ncbi:MAG: nucleotidyltransferase family protein [Calditrichia bacterium]|nr:nucleotidyltransferase family protein [Calditrichia bacterium]
MFEPIKQAVILSAGLGTRMGGLTDKVPKPMLKIEGKPIVEHQLLWLQKWGIEEFFINLYYLPDKVIDCLGYGEKFGVKIHYIVEKELLGTGGAYLAFKEKLNENFLAVNCDVEVRLNLHKMTKHHIENNNIATMALYCPEQKLNYSPVQFIGKNLVDITGKLGKPGNDGVFTGLQILSNKVFDYLPQGVSSIITSFYLPALRENKKVGVFTEIESWIDLGTKELYEQYLLRQKKTKD